MMLSIDNFSILNNVKRVLFWLLSHWLCGSSCAWPHDIFEANSERVSVSMFEMIRTKI